MRTPIDSDTDFSVYLKQESSSGSMSWRYEVYNSKDNPEYSYRYASGWAKDAKQAAKKARAEIDKLMAPYKTPPKLSDFVPHFFKRIV